MPGLSSASSITCSASPTRSRASSVEKVSPTMGATSRCAVGKRGSLGSARQAARSSSVAPSASALFDILDLNRFARNALRQSRGHESVEVTVEHITGAGRGHACPQVLHQLIGLENVGADLVAPADVGLRGIGRIGLRLPLLELGFVEPRLQLLQRRGAILVLGPLI